MAKQKAIAQIYRDWEESYNKALQSCCPETICELRVVAYYNGNCLVCDCSMCSFTPIPYDEPAPGDIVASRLKYARKLRGDETVRYSAPCQSRTDLRGIALTSDQRYEAEMHPQRISPRPSAPPDSCWTARHHASQVVRCPRWPDAADLLNQMDHEVREVEEVEAVEVAGVNHRRLLGCLHDLYVYRTRPPPPTPHSTGLDKA
ncbi:hypothetical protein Ahy_B06g084907 isoform A [Arachis hypogaea]|uniref:Uncharacterized protein n=1 Tax=Arachis hypogaea TaxID=3818 RepID=A0A444YT08_ARAHY|nr:hypothetical protein Ahy_B06g084907 isoform A [Arachis hypogaea]